MDNKEEYSFLYKIILFGPSSAGKTEILNKYVNNNFREDTKHTVGVEFGAKTI